MLWNIICHRQQICWTKIVTSWGRWWWCLELVHRFVLSYVSLVFIVCMVELFGKVNNVDHFLTFGDLCLQVFYELKNVFLGCLPDVRTFLILSWYSVRLVKHSYCSDRCSFPYFLSHGMQLMNQENIQVQSTHRLREVFPKILSDATYCWLSSRPSLST